MFNVNCVLLVVIKLAFSAKYDHRFDVYNSKHCIGLKWDCNKNGTDCKL